MIYRIPSAGPAFWLWPLLALLMCAAVYFHTIPNSYMHDDEDLSYRYTDGDLAETFYDVTYRDVHPPGWYTLFWAWQQAAGNHEYAGRVMGVLVGLLTLSVTYRAGSDWFGRPRYGLLAMLLLATSGYFISYTLDIRPYPVVLLIAVCSMWCYLRWLRRGTLRGALLWGLTLAAMLYVHYFLLFLAAVQGLHFLLSRPGRGLILQGAAGAGLGLGLWLPWLPSFGIQYANLRRVAALTPLEHSASVGVPVPTSPTSWATLLQFMERSSNGLWPLFLLLLLVGLVLLWRRPAYRLALLCAAGVPALVLLANVFFTAFTERYVVFMVVGLALAAGAALAALPDRIRPIAAGAFLLLNLLAYPQYLPDRIPYRLIFGGASAAAGPDDVLYLHHARQDNGFVQDQMARYLSPELQANRVETLEEALTARRVWYVTADWFNEEVREAFKTIESTRPLQMVLGECNLRWCYLAQLLEGPPQAEPAAVFGGLLPFHGADLQIADETLHARLWWQVEERPPADYSIGLHLLDSDGNLVRQTDGPIHDQYAGPVESSQLEPGRPYIDLRSLPLQDLPPGEYRLLLVVYQWWDNARLLLADGSDHLLLETLHLP